MMRRLTLLMAIAITWAAPAAADTELRVRSAEEATASRITVDIPAATRWSADLQDRVLSLRFPRRSLEFATEYAFTGAGVSRMTAAEARQTATGTILALTLACDCAVEVRALGPRAILVEITDGAETPDDAAEPQPVVTEARAAAPPPAALEPVTVAAPEPEPLPEFPAELRGDPPERGAVETARRPWTRSDAAAARRADTEPLHTEPVPAFHPRTTTDPAIADAIDDRTLPPTEVAPTAPVPVAEQDVTVARARILEQLARAADQGLIDLAESGEDAILAAPDPEDIERPVALPEDTVAGDLPETLRGAAADPGTQLRLRTGGDAGFDAAAAASAIEEPDAFAHCPADALFDLADWAGPDPLTDQIAALRTRTVDIRQDPDPASIGALARLYIQAGFGREAEVLLDGHGDLLADAGLLRDLARLVEGRPALPDGPIRAAVGCPGHAGLWNLLALGDGAELPDSPALRAGFEGLPRGLRALIGPRLALLALDFGAPELAAEILAIESRAAHPRSDLHRFASARLALAEGRYADAARGLEALMHRTGDVGADAAITRVELALLLGTPLDEDIRSALEAHVLVIRNGARAIDLRIAQARAEAGRHDLAAALDALRRHREGAGSDGTAYTDAIHQMIADARALEVGASAYARAILGDPTLLAEDARVDAARRAVAGELLAIGLPNAARAVLDPLLARDAPGAALLAAEADLRLGAAGEALRRIASEPVDTVRDTRVAALRRLGDFRSALAASRAGAGAAVDPALAWLAEDWSLAAGHAEPTRRALAFFMNTSAGGVASPADPTLRAALDLRGGGEVSLGLAREAVAATRTLTRSLEEAVTDG